MATRGCSLVVLELQCSVRDRGSYGWVPEDFPPRCDPTSLVVLGYSSYWGTPLGVADRGHGNLFPHVDY